MPLINGQNIDESDYIDESEKDATPANDAGRVTKLEADGRLGVFFTRNGAIINAGETINGATLPVPVYISKADNEAYACDANDTDKYKFVAFAISNGTDGNPIKLQGSGVVSGFSGLSEGEKYYVQDTAGTIGTTPGTMEILVGVAISATELLIQKGKRFSSGVVTVNSGSPDHTITLGFRASAVRIFAILDQGPLTVAFSKGGWTKSGGNRCVQYASDGGSDYVVATRSSAFYLHSGDSQQIIGDIDNIDDNSFRINGDWSSGAGVIFWEAEGEL